MWLLMCFVVGLASSANSQGILKAFLRFGDLINSYDDYEQDYTDYSPYLLVQGGDQLGPFQSYQPMYDGSVYTISPAYDYSQSGAIQLSQKEPQTADPNFFDPVSPINKDLRASILIRDQPAEEPVESRGLSPQDLARSFHSSIKNNQRANGLRPGLHSKFSGYSLQNPSYGVNSRASYSPSYSLYSPAYDPSFGMSYGLDSRVNYGPSYDMYSPAYDPSFGMGYDVSSRVSYSPSYDPSFGMGFSGLNSRTGYSSSYDMYDPSFDPSFGMGLSLNSRTGYSPSYGMYDSGYDPSFDPSFGMDFSLSSRAGFGPSYDMYDPSFDPSFGMDYGLVSSSGYNPVYDTLETRQNPGFGMDYGLSFRGGAGLDDDDENDV